jgi:3-oxoacyl-(acyl-carrier-protein) synthase
VVVTGLGLVTPLGVGVKRNWSGIVAGECAIRSTHELGPSFTSLASRVAAWVSKAELIPFLSNVSYEFVLTVGTRGKGTSKIYTICTGSC